MNAKLLTLISVFCLACLFSAPVLYAFNRSFSGTITYVDPKIRAFIVKGDTGEMTFHPTNDSQFEINGEPVLFGQLQKGDEITIKYTVKKTSPVKSKEH